MIADRKILFIGSYNLDPRSRNINSEVNIVLEGESGSIARELAKEFYEVDLNFARRVTYREMLSYRRPLELINGLALKIKGFVLPKDLTKISKEAFFLAVARYNEKTW